MQKNEFEEAKTYYTGNKSIDAVNNTVAKTKTALKGAMFWITNLVIFIVVGCVCFVDIGFGGEDFGLKSVTINTILLAVCTYWAYLNSCNLAAQKARVSTPWVESQRRFEDVHNKAIETGRMGLLPEFVAEEIAQDLQQTRASVLIEGGVGIEEYKEKGYATMSDEQIRSCSDINDLAKAQIILANKVMPMILSHDAITNTSERVKKRRQPIPDGIEKNENIRKGVKAVSIVLNCFLYAAISVTTLTNITFATITLLLIKTATIIVNIVSGYTSQYNLIAVNEVLRTEARTKYLMRFIAWLNAKNAGY